MNGQQFCRPDLHRWLKASTCGCGILIFACSACPTMRPHWGGQAAHDQAIERRRARHWTAIESERRTCTECGRDDSLLTHAGDGYVWRCRRCGFEAGAEREVVGVTA